NKRFSFQTPYQPFPMEFIAVETAQIDLDKIGWNRVNWPSEFSSRFEASLQHRFIIPRYEHPPGVFRRRHPEDVEIFPDHIRSDPAGIGKSGKMPDGFSENFSRHAHRT